MDLFNFTTTLNGFNEERYVTITNLVRAGPKLRRKYIQKYEFEQILFLGSMDLKIITKRILLYC